VRELVSKELLESSWSGWRELVSKELLESGFLSWRLSELVSKERKEGNLEFAGYQGCSGYD
jgi:hypothetical protein